MPGYGRRARRFTARRKRIYKRRAPVRRKVRRVAKRAYKSAAPAFATHSALKSYLDPFTRNQNPRIPDGSVQFSQGISHQVSSQIAQTDAQTMTVVIVPALQLAINYYQGDGTLGIEKITWNDGVKMNPVDNGGLSTTMTREGEPVQKWRLVSSGMRLKLVNSSEDNSGWFEAARVAIPAESEYYHDFHKGLGTVRPEDFPYGLPGSSMVDNPSYTTDTLKNIDKHAFMLSPNSTEHRWKTLEKTVDVLQADWDEPDVTQSRLPKTLKQDLVDDSYDAIIIRIHGSGVSGDTATRLQLSSTHNHEYVYDIDSSQYKLQTAGGYVSNDMLRMTARRKNVSLRKAAVNLYGFYKKHKTSIHKGIGYAKALALA